MTKSFWLLFSCPGRPRGGHREGRGARELLEGQPHPPVEWAGQPPWEEGRAKNFPGGRLAPLSVPSASKGPITFGQSTTSF